MDIRNDVAHALAKEFGYEDQFEGGREYEMYDRDYWLAFADRVLAVVAENRGDGAVAE